MLVPFSILNKCVLPHCDYGKLATSFWPCSDLKKMYVLVFSVFPKLIRKVNSGLHMIAIFFLFFAIGFALVSLAFCIYNARKVPYQSIKGPLGLYLWNFIAGRINQTTLLCILCFLSIEHLWSCPLTMTVLVMKGFH